MSFGCLAVMFALLLRFSCKIHVPRYNVLEEMFVDNQSGAAYLLVYPSLQLSEPLLASHINFHARLVMSLIVAKHKHKSIYQNIVLQ